MDQMKVIFADDPEFEALLRQGQIVSGADLNLETTKPEEPEPEESEPPSTKDQVRRKLPFSDIHFWKH
jgi:hypothetical protein